MLEFFRRYQRSFFLVVSVLVIFSFLFFGANSTFEGPSEVPDRLLTQKVDGSNMMLSDVQMLSRMIGTDRGDLFTPSTNPANLCNDGVIQKDFIETGLAQLLCEHFFDTLKQDLSDRLERVSRYRPYRHPQSPFVSAPAIWAIALPELKEKMDALAKKEQTDPIVFSELADLYQMQQKFPPEMLRRVLMQQERQTAKIGTDRRLASDDFALFGFHSVSDWFGKRFIDLTSQFILNAASTAKQRGLSVSLEEAKGDLIHHFRVSLEMLKKSGGAFELSFQQHLNSLGLNVQSASKVWQNVLLFRKLFHEIGESAFIDRLFYKDFAEVSEEKVLVDAYEWSICLADDIEKQAFSLYCKAVAPLDRDLLPEKCFSLEEIEKRAPFLIETTYQAEVAEVDRQQVELRATLSQLWDWQVHNWDLLKKEFALPLKIEKERFSFLETLEPNLRYRIDQFSRKMLVKEHPEWVEEALSLAPFRQKSWKVRGNDDPNLRSESKYYAIQDLKALKKRVLLFHEAKPILLARVDQAQSIEQNPFLLASKRALEDLKDGKNESRWLSSQDDELLDQFKLRLVSKEIFKTSKEDWMKEQAFLMLNHTWSNPQLDPLGKTAFFYVKENVKGSEPVLEQICLGKQLLSCDAKTYFAEALLRKIENSQAIVSLEPMEEE